MRHFRPPQPLIYGRAPKRLIENFVTPLCVRTILGPDCLGCIYHHPHYRNPPRGSLRFPGAVLRRAHHSFSTCEIIQYRARAHGTRVLNSDLSPSSPPTIAAFCSLTCLRLRELAFIIRNCIHTTYIRSRFFHFIHGITGESDVGGGGKRWIEQISGGSTSHSRHKHQWARRGSLERCCLRVTCWRCGQIHRVSFRYGQGSPAVTASYSASEVQRAAGLLQEVVAKRWLFRYLQGYKRSFGGGCCGDKLPFLQRKTFC